ncbi:MAG: Long-chain-fatty-acid--CoA ligase [Oscillospiraceae bacterium]
MDLIHKTIGECLRERAILSGESTAISMGSWSCTYAQMNKITDLLALQMNQYGIKKGTHVGIWSVNTPNWVFTFLALTKIGAIPVLINTCYKDMEVARVLNYADVEVLYYDAGCNTVHYEDIIARIRDNVPGVRHFIHMDTKQNGTWMEETDFDDKVKSPDALRELECAQKEVVPEDTACIIFTSGTSSFAKGVCLNHYNLVNNALAMVEAMHWTCEDKMCIVVPLFHCFGTTAGILACLMSGAEMVLLPRFKTSTVWNELEKGRCTILNGVPSMFLALIRKKEHLHRHAGNLKSGIIAGSPISQAEYLEICDRFPHMHLQPSYGQTETSPCVTIANWDDSIDRKSKCAGSPIEHVKVRIADINSGKVLETNHNGEIQVQGYNVMCGYYKLPEITAKAFTSDGWLRTGDIGFIDENGDLHVTGRLKEMIIRGGENISPNEIESVIQECSWVDQVKVVGVPADVLQEEIAACIVPKPGCTIQKEELLTFLKSKLARYKVPTYLLKFDSFPTTASGKIQLEAVKSMAAEMIQQGNSI